MYMHCIGIATCMVAIALTHLIAFLHNHTRSHVLACEAWLYTAMCIIKGALSPKGMSGHASPVLHACVLGHLCSI